jgi:predicted RNA methylase
MDDLFPRKEGIDLNKLQTTEEGLYSITRRRDGYRIIKTIQFAIQGLHELIVTDATGCIGGDTLNLALVAKQVHSIEMNEANFKALQNNVEVYGLTNVQLHFGDSTKIFDWDTDILYIDPPWGGKDYKQHKILDLYMTDKRLDIWLEELLIRKRRPSYIILKLPANYNFKRFDFLSNVDDIKPFQIRSYILVIIYVHKNGFQLTK